MKFHVRDKFGSILHECDDIVSASRWMRSRCGVGARVFDERGVLMAGLVAPSGQLRTYSNRQPIPTFVTAGQGTADKKTIVTRKPIIVAERESKALSHEDIAKRLEEQRRQSLRSPLAKTREVFAGHDLSTKSVIDVKSVESPEAIAS